MSRFSNNLVTNLRYIGIIIVFIFGLLSIIGTSGTTRSARITDTWEAPYNPSYSFNPGEKASTPSDYTIGILKTKFVQKDKTSWVYKDDEMYLFEPFQRGISNAIEKILITKGCKVSGPFVSYEEMTFPERDRCTFLIEPTVIVNLRSTWHKASFRELKNVGGPNNELYAYAEATGTVEGTAEMEYVILDPLTKEKLERHRLSTKPVNENFKAQMQGYYNNETNKPYKWKSLREWAKENPDSGLKSIYASYPDVDNVSHKIFESLYNEAVPKMVKLISVEEFDHLRKYQEKLEKKKVY